MAESPTLNSEPEEKATFGFSLAKEDPVELIDDEAGEYRKVLEKEVSSHKLFSKLTFLTGLGFIVLGFAIGVYVMSIATLGYLLVLVGTIRFLNSFYDLQRKDKLQVELDRLKHQFERRQPSSLTGYSV